jgi:hypothetical protein
MRRSTAFRITGSFPSANNALREKVEGITSFHSFIFSYPNGKPPTIQSVIFNGQNKEKGAVPDNQPI